MFGLSYEIKLNGNPWVAWVSDNQYSYSVPQMICELMSALFKNKWIFAGAIDSGKNQNSLNALYFYHDPNFINEHDLINTSFFALTLNKSDRIRFHTANEELIATVANDKYGIQGLWTNGIQEKRSNNGAIEFKLKGNPWLSSGDEAVESRRLLSNLFNLLSRTGWHLYAVCDLSKKVTNKSTFIFHSKPVEPKSLVNFCLSLNEEDKIRVIDGNIAVVDDVKLAIQQGWPRGIQNESDYYKSFQIKLSGCPFSSHGSDHIYACVMMTLILNNVERRGFRLLCSADVSGKYHTNSDNNSDTYPVDLHSWFFEN
jgi:hypothetical protein